MERLNQGPASLSALLLYSRKSGWSTLQLGTGAHVESGSHWCIVQPVLFRDWTYPIMGIGIKGLTSVEGN